MKRVLYLALVILFCCVMTTSVLADPPTNDDCTNATDAGTLVTGVPMQLSGTLTDATTSCDMSDFPDVWVKFTLTSCMEITIDFCDDDNEVMDMSRYLFTDCTCEDYVLSSTLGDCDNMNPSRTWSSVAAGTYYFPIYWIDESVSTFIVNIAGTDCPSAPANDDCSDAIAIGEVTNYDYTNQGASFDGEGDCMSSANVWYVYTPTFTGTARITIDADYSDKLAVYDGGDCSPLPDQLGCTTQSELDFAVVTGQQYLIEIGSRYSGTTGDGTITIAAAPTAPGNDDCVDADDAGTLVSGVLVQLTGTVAEATLDCEENDGEEVWVKFTITSCMDVTIDFCDDAGIVMGASRYLYASCPCEDGYYVSSRNSCDNDNPSYVWNSLAAGTYYYPIIAMNLEEESYVVNITGTGCASVPDNDECADAITIGEVSDYAYTTQGASFDGEGDCMSSPNVWYVYTASFTGTARITIDADYSDEVAVYDGANCSPIPDQLGCTSQSKLDFAVVSHQQYLIEVGGATSGASGDGTLTIAEAPSAPENDDCTDATDAGTLESGVTVQLTGTAAEATQDCEEGAGAEVWVMFTLDSCMNVTIDYCDYENVVDYSTSYLYSECPCGEGNAQDYMNYCDNGNFTYTWYSLAAGTYYYAILSENIAEGEYTINITGESCSANPDPDFVVVAPYTGTSTTCDANNDCYQIASGEDHIYEVTIPSAGDWSFSLCNSESLWESYLYLGSTICDSDLGDDMYSCENNHAVLVVEDLAAGTYYLTIDDLYGYCGDYILEITKLSSGTYDYVPGDINMSNGQWPPQVIGGDVTYLVNYFRGINSACLLDGFFCSADANGDCNVIGSDVTKMVSYFRGLTSLSYCANYEPTWPTPSECPTEAPAGWPNCGE